MKKASRMQVIVLRKQFEEGPWDTPRGMMAEALSAGPSDFEQLYKEDADLVIEVANEFRKSVGLPSIEYREGSEGPCSAEGNCEDIWDDSPKTVDKLWSKLSDSLKVTLDEIPEMEEDAPAPAGEEVEEVAMPHDLTEEDFDDIMYPKTTLEEACEQTHEAVKIEHGTIVQDEVGQHYIYEKDGNGGLAMRPISATEMFAMSVTHEPAVKVSYDWSTYPPTYFGKKDEEEDVPL